VFHDVRGGGVGATVEITNLSIMCLPASNWHELLAWTENHVGRDFLISTGLSRLELNEGW